MQTLSRLVNASEWPFVVITLIFVAVLNQFG